jgi:hypothetical protein
MSCPKEPESKTMQLDLQLGPFQVETPLTRPNHDFNVPDIPREYQLGSPDIVLEDNPQVERIDIDTHDAVAENVEDQRSIQEPALAIEAHTTNSQLADIGHEGQTREDSNALSPASERILQNASLTASALSPGISGRYIQRDILHGNIMEEIKSTFKFAKKEPVNRSNNTISIKSHQHSADKSDRPPILKYNQAGKYVDSVLPLFHADFLAQLKSEETASRCLSG